MAMVMTKDGQVRPMKLSDLKEITERNRRIEQLEKLNAALQAQIDQMRPVITAVHGYCQSDQYGWDNRATLYVLRDAYCTYESSGGKDGADAS